MIKTAAIAYPNSAGMFVPKNPEGLGIEVDVFVGSVEVGEAVGFKMGERVAVGMG